MKAPTIILSCALLLWCASTTLLFAQSQPTTTVAIGPFRALPTVAVAGTRLSFLVKITNTGDGEARQTAVTNNLFLPFPSGAHFVDLTIVPGSSNFGYVPTGGECTDSGLCHLPTLPVAGSLTLQATIAIDAAQGDTTRGDGTHLEVRSCLQAANAAQDCTAFRIPIERQTDLHIAQRALTPSVRPDGAALLAIELMNLGPSHLPEPAASFVITNQIQGLAGSEISGVSDSACRILNGKTIRCEDLRLQAGERRTLLLTVAIPPTARAQQHLTSCAVIGALAGAIDPDGTSNGPSCTEIHIVAQEADLVLDVTENPSQPLRPGEPFSYTVQIGNQGPSPATAVVVDSRLPRDVQIETIPSFCATASRDDDLLITCSVGYLAPGNTQTFAIHLATAQTIATSPLSIVVESSSERADRDPSNNQRHFSADIVLPADLQSAWQVATLAPVAGDLLQLTMVVTNRGPAPAKQVVVSYTLPAGLLWVASDPACDQAVGCSLGKLAAGEQTTIALTVMVKRAVPCLTAQTVTVEAQSMTFDHQPRNNRTTIQLTPRCQVDLRLLSVTEKQTDLRVGEHFTQTFLMDNLGPGYAHDVVFEAILTASNPFSILQLQPTARESGRETECILSPSAIPPAPMASTLSSSVTASSISHRAPASTVTIQCRLMQVLEAVQTDDEARSRAAAVHTPTAGAGRWEIAIGMIATQPLQIQSVADVSSRDEERNLADNVARTQQDVQCSRAGNADLDLHLQVKDSERHSGLPTFMTGATVALTIAVTNYSQSSPVCAQVIAAVPAHTRFQPAASTAGWDCAAEAPAGTRCAYALTIPAGGSAQVIDFAVKVDHLLTSGTRSTFQVNVIDNGVDPNRTNNDRETEFFIVMPVRYWLPIISR